MHTTALYAPSVLTQKQNTMAYFSVYGADTHFPSSIPQNQNYTMLKPELPASASSCTARRVWGRELWPTFCGIREHDINIVTIGRDGSCSVKFEVKKTALKNAKLTRQQ